MDGRDFNADYTDQLGRKPLHLAVVNDHKEVSVTATHSVISQSITSLDVKGHVVPCHPS